MPMRGWRSRIACAARSPSSVWVGGIRTSTIAASGHVLVDRRQQLVGVARLPHDLDPRAPHAATAMPSRISRLSSAITTRMAAAR